MRGARVFAIVLAAGQGRRFGGAKQLAEFGGLPLVTRAVRNAESVFGPCTLLVCGGADRAAIVRAAGRMAGFFLVNDRTADGIGTSIAAGTRALRAASDGLMILLADQPLITAEHLSSVVEAWRTRPDGIVATSFAGGYGPPVLLPARLFDDVGRLDGDSGAKQLIDAEFESVTFCRFEPAAVDIDRAADLEAIQT